MKTVRCAIYTRKSSEEGLEQAFNSLDAQREACAAYILSQTSEGWVALPDIYDDGGLSGGSLERPALQRLLGEVDAGRIDIIVVYKVDRLTRSLLDFSKLVEAFDKAVTSFVSVTQAFNTTTSMGRLTLNMLLSFAQFEREVTAERIRDKIAASKAKGMWMGGTPPVGYKPDGRSLAIVEQHATIIRDIFARYLVLGNVRLVAEQLERDRVRSPRRTTVTGKAFGGCPFSRGQIYTILKCPTYVGEIHHQGNVYPGLHKAILARDMWDRTQAMLACHLQGGQRGRRSFSPHLLSGKIIDSNGEPLIAVHATKGPVRYRYYVSRGLHQNTSAQGMRIPAAEIEVAVARRVADVCDDALALAATAWLMVALADVAAYADRCAALSAAVRTRDHDTVCQLVSQIRVGDSRVEIDCDAAALGSLLRVERDPDGPAIITLVSDVRLTRSGRAMRLIQGNGASASATIDLSVIKLIVKARRWWLELRKGDIDITALAAREGVTPSYMTRVVRLAFLSPEMVESILGGNLHQGVDGSALTASGAVVACWQEQRRMMLPGR